MLFFIGFMILLLIGLFKVLKLIGSLWLKIALFALVVILVIVGIVLLL